MRREVNVRWMRIVLAVAAVGLFASLAVYEDQARGPNEAFDPFDPKAIQDRIWFEDPITPAEWVGELNIVAGAAYLVAGFALRGRMRWRGIVTTLSIAGIAATAAMTGLVYLMVTDAPSFPVRSGGMRAILLCHGLGAGALAGGWMQLRRAALDPI
jgi:hypothetical protein